MKKEFIPYEQALALKELGFDEPCLGWYHKDELTLDIEANETIEFHKSLGRFKGCFLAPLYQQVFRWFREKEFLIDVTSLNSNEYEFYIQWSFAYSHLSDIYKTYEEAELECLKKLIEIVKQK